MADETQSIEIDWASLVAEADPDQKKKAHVEYEFDDGRVKFRRREVYTDD